MRYICDYEEIKILILFEFDIKHIFYKIFYVIVREGYVCSVRGWGLEITGSGV